MPDLIIKPTAGSGNKLILQDQGGGALLTSDDSGATISATISNLSTYITDVTIVAGTSMMLAGPVIIPNVTANGNLNVLTELNVTTDINIGANGSINIIG